MGTLERAASLGAGSAAPDLQSQEGADGRSFCSVREGDQGAWGGRGSAEAMPELVSGVVFGKRLSGDCPALHSLGWTPGVLFIISSSDPSDKAVAEADSCPTVGVQLLMR